MDDGLEMGVVEIEGVRGDAVDQRRVGDIHPIGAPQHRRLRGRLEDLDRTQRGPCGFVMRCADGTTQPVQKSPVGFMLDFGRPAARWMLRNECAENLRDRRGVLICFDFGVDGHDSNEVETCLLYTSPSPRD